MSLCIHNKTKRYCKECSGSAICSHGKYKRFCIDCGGHGLCCHNNRKYFCKECGGSGICSHGKHKYDCRECNGSSICPHEKYKKVCKECNGSSICSHGRRKAICDECGGSGICCHGKRKEYCRECDGSQICIHNRRKYECKECKGSGICSHGLNKKLCKECGGSWLCKNDWCLTTIKSKYKGYCLYCYIQEFPNEKVVRNYKVKERHVVDRVLQEFPDFTWFHDKKIQDGCSLRRPDLFLDYGTHVIMVEIDEQKHKGYDCSCINRRTMELSLDINHRPCVIIRFNPDAYIDETAKQVRSPWKPCKKTGILILIKSCRDEWENRIKCLLECIDYWVKNPTDKIVEIIELYY